MTIQKLISRYRNKVSESTLLLAIRVMKAMIYFPDQIDETNGTLFITYNYQFDPGWGVQFSVFDYGINSNLPNYLIINPDNFDEAIRAALDEVT